MSPSSLRDLATKLETSAGAFREALEAIPRDSFDPGAAVQRIGSDPLGLFRWVRDTTYLVPYQGSLRGPRGVLMDRLGNSLDRSLLLHELLRVAGHEARLARGLLSPEQAAGLARRAARPPASHPTDTGRGTSPVSTSARNEPEGTPAEAARLRTSVETRVRQQRDAIADAIRAATKDRNPGNEYDDRALMDHWWVQVRQEDKWQDLDPSISGAAQGWKLTPAVSTFDPEGLEESQFHTVKVRVLIERLSGQSLEETSVLEHTLRVSRALDEAASLEHVAEDWPTERFKSGEPLSVQQLNGIVLEQRRWKALLRVGSEEISGAVFDESGQLDGSSPEGGAGGPGALFGGLLGGEEHEQPPAASKVASRLTAEWVEYEVHAPGRPARRFRRPVFDLLGPAARAAKRFGREPTTEQERLQRGLALLGLRQIHLQGCRLSPEYVLASAGRAALEVQEKLPSLVRRLAEGDLKTFLWEAGHLRPFGISPVLAQLRTGWSRSPQALYFDHANILTTGWSVTVGADGRDPVVAKDIDIVANELASFNIPGRDPFMDRLEQGVLDTTLEAALMGDKSRAPNNTGALYAKSAEQGMQWVVLASEKDSQWNRLTVSADARARIKQDLREGYVVMAPRSPVVLEGKPQTGWWRVERKSGGLLGMMASGRGQATTEWAIKSSIVIHGVVGLATATSIYTFLACVGRGNSYSAALATVCGLCAVMTFFFTFSAAFTLVSLGPVAAIGEVKAVMGVGLAVGLGCAAGEYHLSD